MKLIFKCPEARIETRIALLAILPWLYNTAAVDHRLKELGLRRNGKWKKTTRGCEAPVIVARDKALG